MRELRTTGPPTRLCVGLPLLESFIGGKGGVASMPHKFARVALFNAPAEVSVSGPIGRSVAPDFT